MKQLSNREETRYDKLVGRIGENYYFLDYTFKHGEFKGATATILRPVDIDEHKDKTNPESDACKDYFRELWQIAVSDGITEDGLDDWVEQIINIDGDEAVFDFSGYHLWEQLRKIGLSEEEYPVFECVGGGRSFSIDMEWNEIYDVELWEEIKKFEEGGE